ncbi:MAG TPA: hypothetical protein DIU49_03730 [Desulfovibrio sp.]|nr:hypothetical protein [Desulfovibrio sp.]
MPKWVAGAPSFSVRRTICSLSHLISPLSPTMAMGVMMLESMASSLLRRSLRFFSCVAMPWRN